MTDFPSIYYWYQSMQIVLVLFDVYVVEIFQLVKKKLLLKFSNVYFSFQKL